MLRGARYGRRSVRSGEFHRQASSAS
jgi:hypothetical protein